jgi:hypothetical protein
MQRFSAVPGVFSLALCGACGATDGGSQDSSAGDGADTTAAASDDEDDDGPADETTSTSSDDGAAESATTTTTWPGDGTGETTGAAPTGDVWVDAEGEVIGLYRVVVDDDEDAVEGLVDFDDITWVVYSGHTDVGPIDTFGEVFWESTDCTGPMYIAETPSWGSFREGIVASAIGVDYAEVVFVVPPGAQRMPVAFGSWWNALYGCLNFEVGIYDYPPAEFYAQEDLVFVQRPEFVPPLAIEHH